MAEKTGASEFLYSKPENTNSERDWLKNLKQKAEILILRQFFQHVLETLALGQQKKMRWKTPDNFVARTRESHDIHVADSRESRDP